MLKDKLVSELLVNKGDLNNLKRSWIDDFMADRFVIDCQAEDRRLDVSLNVVRTQHFELFGSKALSTRVDFYERSYDLDLGVRVKNEVTVR